MPPENSVGIPRRSSRSRWQWAVYFLALVVIVCVVGVAYWHSHRHAVPLATKLSGASNILLQNNSAFAAGVQQLESNDATNAVESFQTALASASTSPLDTQTVHYWLAVATGQGGDHIAAVDMLKEVASSSASSNVLKAYAIQQMGLLYYATLDPAVTEEIFKYAPFTSFVAPGDTALTYRNLFQYASSFSPLPLSQLYIAQWYADQLIALQSATSTSPLFSNYMGIIQSDLSTAQAGIAAMQAQPALQPLLPLALGREAEIEADLAQVSTTTSASDVDSAFQQAMQSYASLLPDSTNDAGTRFAYAVFLAEAYGSSRASDITQLLAPLTNPAYQRSYFVQSFRDPAAIDATYGTANIAVLVSIDPDFGTFLASLGWPKSDL